MKIVIADDHTLFRDTIVEYIERSEISASVISVSDAHSAQELLNSDEDIELVMLDLRMPGMQDFQGLRNIKDTFPEVPVVILSGLAEKSDIETAMRIGACGYISKTLSGQKMIEGIQDILEGRQFVSLDENGQVIPSYYPPEGYQAEQSAIADHSTKQTFSAEDIKLTPREAEVLEYLSKGKSNKEIARELDLEIVTIKLHVRGIFRKLEAKNRTQAVIVAQKLGIV